MLIDLHCHTRPLSACSALTAAELVSLACERGLDGICLTEHDRAWDAGELAELRESAPIRVFSAVELTTDMGHVLAFGLDPSGFSAIARAVFAAAEASGGVLFLAHPARDGLLRVTHETVQYFASVEAVNGSDTKLQNLAASGLAKGFRLPGIAGSDAHTRDEVGRAATRFAYPVTTDGELLRELLAGRYEPAAVER
ncbi:PHP domain-containing protein [Candidatus Amarobacter glycogenicus]|uniref:PHP domain-containing protein n=1 Tax=Candidatus Amarobacter glycogenicus TaxID=3140699 RepID=UPI0031371C4B|nr:PHP domain-containing protein [Dehalococcoidia bacterium]